MLRKSLFILLGFFFVILFVFGGIKLYNVYEATQIWLPIKSTTMVVPPPSKLTFDMDEVDQGFDGHYIKELFVLSKPNIDASVITISESPLDDQLLVLYSDGTLVRWDLLNQKILDQFRVGEKTILKEAAFSEDGKRLFVPYTPNGVSVAYWIWDTNDKKLIKCRATPDCAIGKDSLDSEYEYYYFPNNGKLLLSAYGGINLDLFDYPSNESRRSYIDNCATRSFNPDIFPKPHKVTLSMAYEFIAYATPKGEVCIYEFNRFTHRDLKTDQEIYLPTTSSVLRQRYELLANDNEIYDLKFDALSQWIAVLTDNNLFVWDVTSFFSPEKIHLTSHTFKTLEFSRSGRFLAAGGSKGIEIYDILSAKKIFTIENLGISDIYFSRDNRLFVFGDSVGNIYVWGDRESSMNRKK